jgi:hypothetical protein
MGNVISRMKKKSQVKYLLINTYRIGFMMAALLAFFVLINFYINNQIDTNYLQSQVLLNRILYSDAIMKKDSDTGRVFTGVVDIKKFNNEQLEQSINYAEYRRHAAVKLKLLNKDPDPQKQFIMDAYLNKDMYDYWKEIVKANVKGKGSATLYITKYPVTYIGIDDNYYYGTLIVEIMIPNS